MLLDMMDKWVIPVVNASVLAVVTFIEFEMFLKATELVLKIALLMVTIVFTLWQWRRKAKKNQAT